MLLVTDSIQLVQRVPTKETLEGLRSFNIEQIIRTVKYADDLMLLTKEETLLHRMVDGLKLEDTVEWK
jgi:hypothetical protein